MDSVNLEQAGQTVRARRRCEIASPGNELPVGQVSRQQTGSKVRSSVVVVGNGMTHTISAKETNKIKLVFIDFHKLRLSDSRSNYRFKIRHSINTTNDKIIIFDCFPLVHRIS